MIEMHGHVVRMRRVVHQRKPFHDVALDGVCEVVHCIGAVGQAEVNDGGGLRVVACSSQKRLDACKSLCVHKGASAGRSGRSSA